jgi:hypothetical protein
MVSGEQILTDIMENSAGGCPIELLTYFASIPYRIPAVLVCVQAGQATIETAHPAIYSLEPSKPVWLPAQGPDVVRGRILSTDPQNGHFVIGDFELESNGFDRRQRIRVEPKATIPARILLENHTVVGRLSELSQEGAGVLIPITGLTAEMRPNQRIYTQITLRGQFIRFWARVVNCIEKLDYARLGLAFELPDDPENTWLAARDTIDTYIARRQLEVDQEIFRRFRGESAKNHIDLDPKNEYPQ